MENIPELFGPGKFLEGINEYLGDINGWRDEIDVGVHNRSKIDLDAIRHNKQLEDHEAAEETRNYVHNLVLHIFEKICRICIDTASDNAKKLWKMVFKEFKVFFESRLDPEENSMDSEKQLTFEEKIHERSVNALNSLFFFRIVSSVFDDIHCDKRIVVSKGLTTIANRAVSQNIIAKEYTENLLAATEERLKEFFNAMCSIKITL